MSLPSTTTVLLGKTIPEFSSALTPGPFQPLHGICVPQDWGPGWALGEREQMEPHAVAAAGAGRPSSRTAGARVLSSPESPPAGSPRTAVVGNELAVSSPGAGCWLAH